MHLAYFDENKFTVSEPFFFIGGIIFPDKDALVYEGLLTQIQHSVFGSATLTKQNEFHGKDIFHGKGNFRKMSMSDRVKIFCDISDFITTNRIPVRMVCIDVSKHRSKYLRPVPEYRLGLMLVLERFCDYLDKVNDAGIKFRKYPLKVMGKGVSLTGYDTNEKWKIIINEEIEIDE